MTATEIIGGLSSREMAFPQAAMEAAIAQREEITPLLLQALEEAAKAPEEFAAQHPWLVESASFLLAQFREKRAYRPLVKILGNTQEDIYPLFEDALTGAMDVILASVYDGDPEPLKQLVENTAVDESVRGSALSAFVIISHSGQMSRQEVVEYYRELLRGKLEREPADVWIDLVAALAKLPAPQLADELKPAFEDGVLEPFYFTWEEVEADLFIPIEVTEKDEKSILMDDAVAEMKAWSEFRFDVQPQNELQPLPEDLYRPPPTPDDIDVIDDGLPFAGLRREGPKIGRNDPCPCGSGKKYKKCCLRG